MEMGNTVPRAELAHTSLAFQASVLRLHHVTSLMSPLSRPPPVYAAPCLKCQCRLLQWLLNEDAMSQVDSHPHMTFDVVMT